MKLKLNKMQILPHTISISLQGDGFRSIFEIMQENTISLYLTFVDDTCIVLRKLSQWNQDVVLTSDFCWVIVTLFIFSSPEHEVLSELLWSFNVRRPLSVVRPSVPPCVNNFFKLHLLWNRLLDFDQTSQDWSLGGPLSKLFKLFQLVA